MIQIVAANNAAGQFIHIALRDLQLDHIHGHSHFIQDTSTPLGNHVCESTPLCGPSIMRLWSNSGTIVDTRADRTCSKYAITQPESADEDPALHTVRL